MSEFEYAAHQAFYAFLLGCLLALYGDDAVGWFFALLSAGMAALHTCLGFRGERGRGRAA